MSTNTSTQKQNWVLALCATASFMVALDATVVSTALTTIRHDLHASLGQLEWTVDAYLLTFAVLIMSAATLGDRFGRRRLFMLGLCLFGSGSALCAISPSMGWLVAGRAIQGVGAAFVMPLGLALMSSAFPPQHRARAMGIYSSVTGLSVMIGPLVGGAVLQGISWPWIFWLNVPISLALIALTRARIEPSRAETAKLDLPGVALISLAILGVVWGLVRATSVGWGSAEVTATLAAGAGFAGGFAAWERRAGTPMLPLRLFGVRRFSAASAAVFCLSAALFAMVFFVAQFLQVGLGYGPLASGLHLAPWGLTTATVPLLARPLAQRLGDRVVVSTGLAVTAISAAWIALIAEPHLDYAALVPPLVLSGAGLALAIPAIQGAIIGAVSPLDIGKASGTSSTLRQIGALVGIAAAAAAFGATGSYQSPHAFSHGFAAAMAVCAGMAAIGAVAGSLLSRAERPASAGQPAGRDRSVDLAPPARVEPGVTVPREQTANDLITQRTEPGRGHRPSAVQM